MHVDQECVCVCVCVCVCGNLKYPTQEAQYQYDTLMDAWQRDKPSSSERFLKFRHPVLSLEVPELAGIV